LNLTKKVASVGISATLLASLFATALAPTAFGAVSVNPAGLVPVGGTSTGTVTFTFTEASAAAFTNAAGCFDVWIGDSGETAPLLTDVALPLGGHLSFSGTPSVAGSPGSLGASASIIGAGNVLQVCIGASDIFNVEPIIVSGLKISATSTAATGAIQAQMFNFSGSIQVADLQSGGTASGQLSINYPTGTTAPIVNVTTTGCLFVDTATSGYPLTFSSNGETETITAVSALVANQQTLTINATTSVHQANEVVTEANACAPNGVIASPGTVANAVAFSSDGNPNVFPGESNNAAADLFLDEQVGGFLTAGTTVTITIGTANVVFSNRPSADPTASLDLGAGAGVAVPMTLSADRKSASFTVATASGVASEVEIFNIAYDVAASVPGGTFISVTAVASGGLLIVPASVTNAVVARGVSVTATPTTVFIGQNAQKAGLVTITELNAGFFQGGTGSNNTIEVCLDPSVFATLTSPGPTAKVTAGDLVLREGTAASTDNIVLGTPDSDPFDVGDTCYFWTVWTASTKASTIVIGNSDLTTGPLIDVPPVQPQGPVVMDVFIGNGSVISGDEPDASVTIANAVFQSSVVVTALSQPSIPAGSTDALAGNIQVAETSAGQLKLGEDICVEVLPRQSNEMIQDTFLKALTTADLPIASSSGGLVISAVVPSSEPCEERDGNIAQAVLGTHTISFAFQVLQQSTLGTGKVVISNIHYITTADAPNGPVLVNVFGFGEQTNSTGTVQEFQSTISNAIIGNGQYISTDSAVGVTKSGPFSVSTKVVKKGSYVTIRFETSPALAGAKLGIWISKKGADGTWSAYSPHTSRIADGKGVVYYYYKAGSVAWLSFKAVYVGNGIHPSASSPAIQARWVK